MEMTLLNIVSASQDVSSSSVNPITIILGSGLTAALASGVINNFINNRKIHADIVSKSRVDWIQQVRSATSEYLAEVSNLLIIIAKIKDLEIEKSILMGKLVFKDVPHYYQDDLGIISGEEVKILDPAYESHNEKLISEIEDISNEINKAKTSLVSQKKIVLKAIHLLRLYFPTKTKSKNKIHLKIKRRMSLISSFINYFNKLDYDNKDIGLIYKYINIELNNLSELISNYLKDEWEVAKKNKI